MIRIRRHHCDYQPRSRLMLSLGQQELTNPSITIYRSTVDLSRVKHAYMSFFIFQNMYSREDPCGEEKKKVFLPGHSNPKASCSARLCVARSSSYPVPCLGSRHFSSTAFIKNSLYNTILDSGWNPSSFKSWAPLHREDLQADAQQMASIPRHPVYHDTMSAPTNPRNRTRTCQEFARQRHAGQDGVSYMSRR